MKCCLLHSLQTAMVYGVWSDQIDRGSNLKNLGFLVSYQIISINILSPNTKVNRKRYC